MMRLSGVYSLYLRYRLRRPHLDPELLEPSENAWDPHCPSDSPATRDLDPLLHSVAPFRSPLSLRTAQNLPRPGLPLTAVEPALSPGRAPQMGAARASDRDRLLSGTDT
jgi:hypothetical protein